MLYVRRLDGLGISEVEAAVVETLGQQDDIRECVVDGQDDLENVLVSFG